MNYKKLENKKQSLEFAVVFALLFIVLNTSMKDSEWIQRYSIPIAACFLIAGIFFSKILTPLSNIWQKVGLVIGFVTNKVLLSGVFYLLIFPLAVAKRLFSKKNPTLESYWIKEKRTFNKESLTNPF